MVLGDVAIQTDHEKASSLLAIIRETVRLSKKDTASAQRLERSSLSGRIANQIEHVLDRWIDGVGKSFRSCDVEYVNGPDSIRSVTKDSVLRFCRQNLALPNGGSFVQVEPLIVDKEIRFTFTRREERRAFAEARHRNWTTEAPTKLIEAKLALRYAEIIVLKVGCVQAFITMLPKTSSVIFVRAASRREFDRDRAIAGTLGSGRCSRDRHFVNRIDTGANEGEKPV